jgi:GT2 family glycosyltransferase
MKENLRVKIFSQTPQVAIIILNWNGLKDTLECLESLNKITYPDYEVVLVDNGSRGGDADVLQSKCGGKISLIRNVENKGFAGGNNEALRHLARHSNASYYLLLNNDTVVAPDFLDELVKIAESDTKIAIAGPKTYFFKPPDMLQTVWLKVNMGKGTTTTVGSNVTDKGQFNELKQVGCLQGSCLLLKKEVVNSVGLLDEDYFCYWEESDYCARVNKAGYKIMYVPAAKIWHKKSVTIRPKWYNLLFAKDKHLPSYLEIYLMTRNTFMFMKKQAEPRQRRLFYIYYFCVSFWYRLFIYLIYYRKASLLKAFFKGIGDGLKIKL